MSLVAAAVCPHPPLLLPGLTGAGSPVDPAAELRAACLDAVRRVLSVGTDVVVLVAGDPAAPPDAGREWDPGAASGVEGYSAGRVASQSPSGDEPLPLGLAVGRHLLDAAGWTGPRRLVAVSSMAAPADCLALGRRWVRGEQRVALVALGDGSARRTLKAPGYLDPRALELDALAEKGLHGDLGVLRELDPLVCGQLLVAGRAAWQVLAGAAEGAGAITPTEHLDADPYGVRYLVVSWAVGIPLGLHGPDSTTITRE